MSMLLRWPIPFASPVIGIAVSGCSIPDFSHLYGSFTSIAVVWHSANVWNFPIPPQLPLSTQALRLCGFPGFWTHWSQPCSGLSQAIACWDLWPQPLPLNLSVFVLHNLARPVSRFSLTLPGCLASRFGRLAHGKVSGSDCTWHLPACNC